MPHNPFAKWPITGTWAEHMSYSLGGEDYPTPYGYTFEAPASGTLQTSGGSGEFKCGWVGTAGRRSILHLDTPIGDCVAIVFQHQHAFGAAKHYNEGEAGCGVTGASANLDNYGGDIHMHWHGLTAGGKRLKLSDYISNSSTAGGGGTPINPSSKDEDLMIRIQSTNRGIALVGAGYYRILTSNEEVEQSGPMISAHYTGNDRQFDLWASMALGGVSALDNASLQTLNAANAAKASADAAKVSADKAAAAAGGGSTGGVTPAQITEIAKQTAAQIDVPTQFIVSGKAVAAS